MVSPSQHWIVVEDSPADVLLLKRRLNAIPHVEFDLSVCSTGEQALTALAEKPASCLFIDNRLGSISGVDLLKQIRNQYDVAVVALTGMDNEEDMLKAGAHQYLHKDECTPKTLERAIRNAQRIATLEKNHRGLEKQLKDFVYAASHDLKAPIRRINSFCDILNEDLASQLDDTHKEYMGFIQSSAKQAMALIDGLLELSRVGREDVPSQEISFEAVYMEAFEKVREAWASPNAEIELGDAPSIFGKPDELAKLLRHLISNALLYQPDGNVAKVRLWAERNENECVIRVSDNGIGVSPEYHEEIFKPFARLHTEDEYPGVGLGLAVCKKIVDLHGGSMGISSSEGEGATFWVRLPIEAC